MENRSFALSATPSRGVSSAPQLSEDWRLARDVHTELLRLRMPYANLLVVGRPGVTRILLDLLWLELREPIVTWRPQQPLPEIAGASTLILYEADRFTIDEQEALFSRLNDRANQIRVVTTTAVPLWPAVKAGRFHEGLYYRLNTISLDATAQKTRAGLSASSAPLAG